MTTTALERDLSALPEAIATLGLQLGPEGPAPAELAAPILTAAGVTGSGDRSVFIAVVDGDGQADAIIQALAGAVARVHPDLEFRPGDPLPNLEVLTASVDRPVQVRPVMNGGACVGAIVHVEDRRGDGTPSSGTGGGATSSSFGAPSAAVGELDMLRNVTMTVTAELGRTELKVSDILGLQIGSVIELDRAAGAPIDFRVNDTLLARGEVVVVDDEYAIRLTEILDPKRI